MKIHQKIEQGSEEWQILRLGKITGSEMYKYLTPKTYKISSDCRKKYIYDLIGKERVIYDEEDRAEFPAIPSYIANRGHAGEIEARSCYQEQTFNIVNEIGFIESGCGNFGFSPDGIVEEKANGKTKKGFIEIKTINSAFMMKAMHEKSVMGYIHDDSKGKYWLQIMLGFYINPEFEFCDFILYSQSLKNQDERFFVERIERPVNELIEFGKGMQEVIELKQQIKQELFK